jgi:TPR repeat protein
VVVANQPERLEMVWATLVLLNDSSFAVANDRLLRLEMHKLNIYWLRQAAAQGQAPAQNALGWMYLKCLGVHCDSPEAAEWFHKSAEQGYPIAVVSEHFTDTPA